MGSGAKKAVEGFLQHLLGPGWEEVPEQLRKEVGEGHLIKSGTNRVLSHELEESQIFLAVAQQVNRAAAGSVVEAARWEGSFDQ